MGRTQTFPIAFLILTVVGCVMAWWLTLLYVLSPPLFVLWLVMLIGIIIYCLVKSFHIIRQGAMLSSSFLGTWQVDYVNGSFAEKKDRRGRTMLERGGKRGLFGSDIVFLLFPLWNGKHIPTTEFSIQYRFSHGFPKGQDAPIVLIIYLSIRLAPGAGRLFDAFELGLYGNDLTEICEVEYMIHQDPNTGEVKKGTYKGNRMAAAILGVTEGVMHEALRAVASTMTWEQIKADIHGFEQKVLLLLSLYESAFAQGGLLEEREKFSFFPPTEGPATLALDANLQESIPENEAARAALSAPFTADYQAKAAAREGEGQGDRIANKAEKAGTNAEFVMTTEASEKIDQWNQFNFAPNLLTGAAQAIGQALAGRKAPKPKGKKKKGTP